MKINVDQPLTATRKGQELSNVKNFKLEQLDIGVTKHIITSLDNGIVLKILELIQQLKLILAQETLCVYHLTVRNVYLENMLSMFAIKLNGVTKHRRE